MRDEDHRLPEQKNTELDIETGTRCTKQTETTKKCREVSLALEKTTLSEFLDIAGIIQLRRGGFGSECAAHPVSQRVSRALKRKIEGSQATGQFCEAIPWRASTPVVDEGASLTIRRITSTIFILPKGHVKRGRSNLDISIRVENNAMYWTISFDINPSIWNNRSETRFVNVQTAPAGLDIQTQLIWQ